MIDNKILTVWTVILSNLGDSRSGNTPGNGRFLAAGGGFVEDAE